MRINTPNGHIKVDLREFFRRSGISDCRRLVKLIRQDGRQELLDKLRFSMNSEIDEIRADRIRLVEIKCEIDRLRKEKAEIVNPDKRQRTIDELKKLLEKEN